RRAAVTFLVLGLSSIGSGTGALAERIAPETGDEGGPARDASDRAPRERAAPARLPSIEPNASLGPGALWDGRGRSAFGRPGWPRSGGLAMSALSAIAAPASPD